MSRYSTVSLCAAALVVGIVLGAHGDWWRFGTSAQADPSDGTATERGYRELQAGHSSLADSSELLAKISRLTTNSVVHIESERRSKRGSLIEETGSGVIMESSKQRGFFVVSNRHVVDETPLEQVSIHLHDGRVIHPTKLWTDKATDVAIMRVAPTNLQASRWGDSDKVEIGHLVLAMGSPFGLSQSVTLGIISAKGRRSLKMPESSEMINQDFLQTDAAINPGNSGGPLIDMQGQVIGINTAIASQSGGNEGIGFSIPSNLVRRVIDQLLEHGKVIRAYLGVSLDPDFTSEKAAALKLDRLRGARVVSAHPDSPAARADLRKDDVILTYDGIEVLDENHLINLVSLTAVGKKVKVVIFRGGKHQTLEVSVGDREDFNQTQQQRSEAPSQPGMGIHFESLGLTLHQLDSDLAPQLGFEKTAKGLLVLKVDRNGPMDGEIHLYDLIEEVARTPVSSLEELSAALDSAASNDAVLLTVKRRAQGHIQTQVVVYRR